MRISLANPVLEADQHTPADLLCGVTATLEIASGALTWRDEHFPVLELALALRRQGASRAPFLFASMCVEDDPVLAITWAPESAAITLYDGTRVRAPHEEIEHAVGAFVEAVNQVVRDLCGLTVADLQGSLQ